MNNKDQDYKVKIESYFTLSAIIILLFILMMAIVNLEHFIKRKERNSDIKVENTLRNTGYINQVTDNTCLIITGKDKDRGIEIIEEGLEKAKIGFRLRENFWEVTEKESQEAEIIIINGKSFRSFGNLDLLFKYLKKGKYIIFTSMPEVGYINESGLGKIIGIRSITELQTQQEVKFLPGFLLGGLLQFKNLFFEAPEVQLLSTAKPYVTGRNSSAIIWRNTYNGSEIYVINGPFMETKSGYGILSAILSQIYTEYIYPIINAKVYTYTGLPYAGNGDTVELERLYNRNAVQLQKDILIPDILSITKSRGITPIGFLSNNLTENKVETEYYNKKQIENYENDTYNLIQDTAVVYSGDLKKDSDFYYKLFGSRKLRAIRIGEEYKNLLEKSFSKEQLKSIDAVIGQWMSDKNNFAYIGENTVYIPFTGDGAASTDMEELELYSGVTAFGAIIQNLDFDRVMYPKEDTDNWLNISRKYIEFIDSYREKFKAIKPRDISEAAISVKKYILCTPVIKKNENKIEISFKRWYGECSYILRTRREVESISGGTIEKIEEGAYLITAESREVVINLSQTDSYGR